MASNYPTSLDSFNNPSGTDSLNSPSHSLQHSDINDAVEAIEAKLGIGASPAGSATSGQVLTAQGGGTALWQTLAIEDDWIAYTPSLTNITLGNGTLTARYKQIGKTVHFHVQINLGSTSSINSGGNAKQVSLPVAVAAGSWPCEARLEDTGTNLFTAIGWITPSVATIFALRADLTYGQANNLTNTVPFTFTTNDVIVVSGTYRGV